MQHTLVSIITVCFNAADTIEKTIGSVVNQSYNNIEYIVIDGDSTDGTKQILERHRGQISKIVIEKDEGIYDAMNKGISLAHGDYIGIINADDWYEQDAVEKIVQISQNISENIGVISGQIRFIEGDQSFISKKGNLEQIWIEMPIFHPATFVKRSIYENYGKYNTHYKIAADYDLIFRFFINHVKFYLSDEIFANFRIGGTSSAKKKELFREDVEILRSYQKYCPMPDRVEESIRRKESISLFYQADRESIIRALEISSKEEEIYIFGCGYWGREAIRQMKQWDIAIEGFLDNNSALWRKKLSDVLIFAPDVLHEQQNPKVIIAIQGDTSTIEEQIMHINKGAKCINLEVVLERIYRIYRGDED